jgi:hypothetical protein
MSEQFPLILFKKILSAVLILLPKLVNAGTKNTLQEIPT